MLNALGESQITRGWSNLCNVFISDTELTLRRGNRKVTGNSELQAQSEIDQRSLSVSTILVDALVKPIEITIKDPAVFFVNIYTALFYGIFYSFFEVFPLVFPPIYEFNLGETGLAFLSCQVGATLGIIIYFSYLYWYMIPDNLKNGLRQQEHRLVPAVFGSFFLPTGLFIFGWTARPDIHCKFKFLISCHFCDVSVASSYVAARVVCCMHFFSPGTYTFGHKDLETSSDYKTLGAVPLIGVVIFLGGAFLIFQSIFVYVPLSYRKYSASLFAGNDFIRSSMAAGSILYARPLFINLGIGRGVSVLAGLTTLGIFGIIVLYLTGAKLRARSRFAQG